nr:uncharacterized protein LOC123754412 isoform X2 [Procambarus clarkii]
MVWSSVGQVWADLWYLPPSIPSRATHLLHAHLLHAQLLHGHLESYVYDITRPLLTLLAVRARKIAIVPVDRQFASLSSPAIFCECGVYKGEHQLQELDLTGVDLGLDMKVLLALLPVCPELTVLKLGGNTTPDVLQAAKTCPLTVLHISERSAKDPRVSESDLMEIIIGSRNHNPTELLSSIRRGRMIEANPTWPQMSDFSTGHCKVQQDFLLLLLAVLTKLNNLSCKSLDLQKVICAFDDLIKESPKQLKLSLKSNQLLANEDFLDTLSRVAPDIEDVKVIYRRRSIQNIASDILTLHDNFPSLKALHIFGMRHASQSEPSPEVFACIGIRLKILELDEICLRDIPSLLQVCPLLQDLTLTFKHGIKCDHTGLPDTARFENVITLNVKSSRLRQEPLSFLLKMLPNLQTIAVQGRVDNVELFLGYLTQLTELRTVKMTELETLEVASLCELPRMVSDRRPWELYASPHILNQSDIKTLQNCGWTYIPFREYTFKIGNLYSFSLRHVAWN